METHPNTDHTPLQTSLGCLLELTYILQGKHKNTQKPGSMAEKGVHYVKILLPQD